MKVKLVTLLLLVLVAAPLLAKPPASYSTRKAPRSATSLDYSHYIDANNILMFVTNDGQFARDLSGVFGYDYGTFFPFNGIQYIQDGSGKASPLYASGLWVGGIDSASGEIRVKVAEYNTEYCPGPVDVANGTFYADRPEFKLYHLYSDSLATNPNEDYTNWIVAARQGAPFEGQYTGSPDSTKPVMLGDQMTWAVFNDLNLANQNDAGHTNALGVEIRQTTFAFKREGPLNNIIFVKFQAYNRTDRVIQNAYFSLWADPDLGGSSDDLVGCDTTLSLGFIYNANNNDQEYHSKPPCLGYDFFQGPLQYTGDSINDIGKAWGKTWPGYKNLGMVSFNKYINGTDPSDFHETYNYMQGLQADGSPLANGTKYQVPGDPVAGTGELDVAPADRRFMQTTGPITFRPGDSTEILAAIIVGQGGDRLSSISVMKFYDITAQDAYNNDFQVPAAPVAPVVSVANLTDKVVLRWTDTSEVNHGDYPFQGYTVYQGTTSSGPWTQIANFDVIDGISNILDQVLDPATGILETRGVKVASDNGIQRYLNITTDKINGGNINALTRYYFRVEAYSYDGSKLPKTLTSATNLSTVPEAPLAGENYFKPSGDTIPATHVGSSDGSVQITVLDPKALLNATYRVVFGTDSILGSVWHLVRTQGLVTDTVLKNQVNQTGDTDYRTVDGLLIKVMGPALNFKNFETVANATGPLDPSEGAAAGFQGFPCADPTARQQSNGQRWLIHTGDNGTRASYASFLSRTVRDGLFWPLIIPHDYEIRFTAGTNWGVDFNTDSIPIPLPFELWDIGIATPGDASDDYRLIPSILDNDADGTFNLSSYDANDHSVSSSNNDPYTDWIYWFRPTDRTPGHAGYDSFVSHLTGGDWGAVDDAEQFMSRMVFVGWNLGVTPPFTPDMPETGTVFRITSTKPNAETDTFTFVTAPPATVASEAGLSRINTVPNPYYLFGPYDPTPGNRTIKFQHLPAKCTIKIYNLSGDMVRTLDKDDASTSTLEWDVLTDNLLPLASGVYIYVVDAPGYGTKTGKMAIFNQTEVLQKY